VIPLADTALALRLEGAERASNARFVEARASLSPEVGAAWIDVDGTYAMFDGVSSPCTQTFGFGLFSPPAAPALDAIERFFLDRSAPVFHEVCPLAHPAHMPLLAGRGYHPVELSNVMFQPLPIERAPSNGEVVVRRAAAADTAVFAQTFADGWADPGGLAAPLVLALARITAARPDAHAFLAEHQGRPIGAGALVIHERVALLAGASTIPEARGRGAQLALLAHRLAFAAECGCDLAMVVALPGSGSQRNAERNGFRIAYTRTKWQLA